MWQRLIVGIIVFLIFVVIVWGACWVSGNES